MQTKMLMRSVCLTVLGLAALSGPLQTARSTEDHVSARELQQAGKILPLDEIVTRAKSQQAGKIIEVELHRAGDRYEYEIEFLDDDGTVHELRFDARSGDLVSRHREH